MATRMMVALLLTGEFDPEEITRRVGVQPSFTCRRGDPVSKRSTMRQKFDGWRFSTGEEDSFDLGARIRGLLDLLHGRAADFSAVCKDLSLDAEIECVVYMYGAQGPALSIDSRTVAEIAEYGASIDIDLYALGDENKDADGAD